MKEFRPIGTDLTLQMGDGAGSTESHPQPLLMTAEDAASQLSISKAHFYRMHNAGKIPLPVRLGGAVRWRVEELRAWIAAGMPSRQRWQAMQEGGVQ